MLCMQCILTEKFSPILTIMLWGGQYHFNSADKKMRVGRFSHITQAGCLINGGKGVESIWLRPKPVVAC